MRLSTSESQEKKQKGFFSYGPQKEEPHRHSHLTSEVQFRPQPLGIEEKKFILF